MFFKGAHDIGRTNLLDFHIDTADASPIKQRSYRHSPQHKQEIDKQVHDMLDNESTGKLDMVNAERLKLFVDIVEVDATELADEADPHSTCPLQTDGVTRQIADHIIEREIVKILDERVVTNKNRRKIRQYLVKWKGTQPPHESWIDD